VRMPEWTKSNLKALYTGSETNIHVLHESELQAPQQEPQAPPQATSVQVPAAPLANAQTQSNAAQPGQPAQLRFEPRILSLKAGQTATVGVMVDHVVDLFSVPLLMRYDPSIISVEDVRHGEFLQAGGQAVAVVLQVDKEHGEAIFSATRQPNTAGASGTGTILEIVIKGLTTGTSTLSIVQVNARDSQQRPIQLGTSEASVQVIP
jgi:general secretion pathway protein D